MRPRPAAFWVNAMLIALYGCGGGGGGNDGGSAPPAASPQVDLSVNSATARVGEVVTLTWTSQGATSCTASGNWAGARTTSGSDTLTLSEVGPMTFILTCNGAGGAGSDTATLAAAPAMQQVTIPGVPAPINYSKGTCIPEDTANYTIKCLNAASEIVSKYDIFTSDLSARVTLSPNTQPVTTLGGACTAGFDRLQNRVAVETTILDYFLPMTGSTIVEVIYKPALLDSVGQGAISQMSALIFHDNSNTERMGIIVHAVVSGDPLIVASAGTFAASGAVDLTQCIADDSAPPPPPPPPPPPSSVSCPAAYGSGQNGLEFVGTTSYSIAGGSAGATTPRSMGWGVRYNNPNLSSSSYTGSLRVTLWAVSSSFTGGTISGYKLFTGTPSFVGAGARSSNQIYNFYTFPDITSSGSGANPPAGSYCIVAALDQFSDSCTSADGYCYADWVQFDGAEEFQ